LAPNLERRVKYCDTEAGLNYNYQRDYDSAAGRYVESDPLGLRGGINTYAYTFGNPVNLADPTGLATAVAYSGAVSGNPFGHVGLGFGDAGIYSYGTSEPYGSSFTTPRIVIVR
jgi:RHS repeat-associated protein